MVKLDHLISRLGQDFPEASLISIQDSVVPQIAEDCSRTANGNMELYRVPWNPWGYSCHQCKATFRKDDEMLMHILEHKQTFPGVEYPNNFLPSEKKSFPSAPFNPMQNFPHNTDNPQIRKLLNSNPFPYLFSSGIFNSICGRVPNFPFPPMSAPLPFNFSAINNEHLEQKSEDEKTLVPDAHDGRENPEKAIDLSVPRFGDVFNIGCDSKSDSGQSMLSEENFGGERGNDFDGCDEDDEMKYFDEMNDNLDIDKPVKIGDSSEKRTLQCPHCSYTSCHRYRVQDHIDSKHHDKKKYGCVKCTFVTSSRESLKNHYNYQHRCHLSMTRSNATTPGFLDINALPRGILTPLNDDGSRGGEVALMIPVLASEMSQPLSTPRPMPPVMLVSEIEPTEGSVIASCNPKDNSKYFKQFRTPSGQIKYQCLQCPYESGIRCNVLDHINGVHLHIKTYGCPYVEPGTGVPCQFRTSHRVSLRSHMKTQHQHMPRFRRNRPEIIHMETMFP